MTTEIDAGPIRPNIRRPSIISPTLYNSEGIFDFDGLEKAEKFVERNDLLTDAFEYPRDGSDPGQILIFNQEEFPYTGDEKRKGSRRDVNELVLCFQRQGFNIGKKDIMHNGTTEQIKNKLKEVSEMDLSEKNCLIIFFLTHGKDEGRLLTLDGSLSNYDILKNFIQCEHLKNKPKMFVFQACKGRNFSTTIKTQITEESTTIVPHSNVSTTYMGPDMLVVYSTIEGNVSYRNSLTGSWFIQELCKNFNAYGKRDDLFSLITRTSKCVTGNYYHHETGVNKKQMPVCMSTLSKKFYLNRNRDRNMVLMYRNYYEHIVSQIREIRERVERLS